MGEFYWSFRTQGPYSGSEEESRNICYVCTSSIKISHRCRALKAKEICKKRDVEAKLFFVFLLNLLLL